MLLIIGFAEQGGLACLWFIGYNDNKYTERRSRETSHYPYAKAVSKWLAAVSGSCIIHQIFKARAAQKEMKFQEIKEYRMKKRSEVEVNFNKSRSNLLLVIVFSVLNVILTLVNAGINFLFSATFPMFVVGLGQAFSDKSGDNAYLIIAVIVAFILIACYGVCYLLSKKHKAFIVVALVFFSIDTLFLLWILSLGIDYSAIFDIAFHVWVVYSLIIGVKAWLDLKKLPLNEEIVEDEMQEHDPSLISQSNAIRPQTPKGRVILSQNYNDLEIVIKRVFGTTELIINGIVYAEKKGLVETNYILEACIDDTIIKAAMDTSAFMCLYVNGNLLSKKKRII